MFGLSQVICPVNRELCSGAYFDCYSTCRRQADEAAAWRRQNNREHREWMAGQHRRFEEQLRSWDGTTPCPRCQATVEPPNARAHMDWHWANDKSL